MAEHIQPVSYKPILVSHLLSQNEAELFTQPTSSYHTIALCPPPSESSYPGQFYSCISLEARCHLGSDLTSPARALLWFLKDPWQSLYLYVARWHKYERSCQKTGMRWKKKAPESSRLGSGEQDAPGAKLQEALCNSAPQTSHSLNPRPGPASQNNPILVYF